MRPGAVARSVAMLLGMQNVMRFILESGTFFREICLKTVVNSHSNYLPYKFAVNVKERQDKLPTMYSFLSCTKDHIKLDSLPTVALALQHNCLND